MSKKTEAIELPPIPAGHAIITRPANLDMLVIGKSKWRDLCIHVHAMPNTQAYTLDIGNLLDTPAAKSKAILSGIRQGIRIEYRKLGFKEEVKFAVANNRLMIWVNK